tara:strand:- start:54 stop:542 length:489 start_codon:yes stop_codon:yes gene_type:complete
MKIKYILIFLIFLCGCIPSVFISSVRNRPIEKNYSIYVSKSDGISIEENVFRENLNIALKKEGYFTVNNFQKSKYYLFIDFNNRLQKKMNYKINIDIFSIQLFLIESKNISDSSGLPFDIGDALWVCKIELTWLEFLKHQDDIVEIISKYFCNTYIGKKILF